MALRMLGYAHAGYEEMERSGQLGASGLLTPILSIVLHTGDEEWTAKRDMLELIEKVPESMRHLVVRQAYELVEQRVVPEPEAMDEANVAQAAMAEGRSVTARDLHAAHDHVWELVKDRPHLKAAYVIWSLYNLSRRSRGRRRSSCRRMRITGRRSWRTT